MKKRVSEKPKQKNRIFSHNQKPKQKKMSIFSHNQKPKQKKLINLKKLVFFCWYKEKVQGKKSNKGVKVCFNSKEFILFKKNNKKFILIFLVLHFYNYFDNITKELFYNKIFFLIACLCFNKENYNY